MTQATTILTRADRHDGRDRDILEQRHAVYQHARAQNPRRWAKETRNWSRVEVVTLNPEKQKLVGTASAEQGHKVGLAA